MKNSRGDINTSMKLSEVVELLRDGAHILSKNYHDGSGRQWWLRDKKQETLRELSEAEFRRLRTKVRLREQQVISSDEAFWYEMEDK